MRTRSLGRTGLAVSEIGFGCGVTAGLMINAAPQARREAITRALDLGINYFDTAPVYGQSMSEQNLGEALSALGVQPIVATKVALEIADLDDITGAVVRSVEASLSRLRLPRLPLVQLHNRVGQQRSARGEIGSGAVLTIDDVLGERGVVGALRSLRKRGLVQWFGCCAYGGDRDAIERVIDSDTFDTMLVNYSMLNTTAWAAAPRSGRLRDYGCVGARAAGLGIGIIALRVLEGGALSGRDGPHPISRGGASPDYPDMEFRAARVQAGLGEDSVSDTAIRFALSNPQVSTVLIGFSDAEQIEAAAACAIRGPLPAQVHAQIEQLRESDFGLSE
ncbi:MAG: aldo/keto reductase [Burkholderiales bacterium]